MVARSETTLPGGYFSAKHERFWNERIRLSRPPEKPPRPEKNSTWVTHPRSRRGFCPKLSGPYKPRYRTLA